MKIVLRILAAPFILGIMLITYNCHALCKIFMFLKHGGEWVTYKPDDKSSMELIFRQLKEQNDKA